MLPLLSKEKRAKKIYNHSKVNILEENAPLSIYQNLISLTSVHIDEGLDLSVYVI